MPNLKDIRRRIKSVKNTQKITQAMRMVAAAKVRRAEARMKAGRPFADELQETMEQILPRLRDHLAQTDEESSSRYLPLLKPRSINRVGLVVITSDRGLCGAFNTNVLRQAALTINDYQARGMTPRVYLVGSKAVQFFKKRFPTVQVLGMMQSMTAAPTPQHGRQMMESLLAALLDGQVDRVDVLYTRFRSMVSYEVTQDTLFPLTLPVNSPKAQTHASAAVTPKKRTPQPEWLIEPTVGSVLDVLLPMYLQRILFSQLLESTASELAARMTAMASATDNAKAMINSLTLVYNKARQASITQEIMEIVGGAEALSG